MESATFLLLLALKATVATSLSVMYGWQPLPGDSQKLEYIVQLEPELAARLDAGQAIPITSDIPEDLGPIGRIRIVVGRGELPQQQLVKQFKPLPAQKIGVVETQYTVAPVQPSGRYAAQPAANNEILPPQDQYDPARTADTRVNPFGAGTQDAFGRTLQQGAAEARSSLEESRQILPPADQLFGPNGNQGQNVRTAINQGTNELRNDFPQGVTRAADQTGQRLLEAAQSAEQSIQDAVGRTQPSGGQPAGTILPPGSAEPRQRIDQPFQPQQPSRFAQPSLAATRGDAAGNPPEDFQRPLLPPLGSEGTTASGQQAPRYGNSQPAQTQPAQSQAAQSQSTRAPQTPQWPSETGSSRPLSGSSPASPTAASRDSGVPEIRRGMLPLQETSQAPATYPSAAAGNDSWPSRTPSFQQTAAQQPLSSQPFGSQPFGTQPFGTQQFANATVNSQPAPPSSTERTNLFPLLLSWVLLSGSGAGNLYLFWSYMDVRSKYRGVVHGLPNRDRDYD